MVKIATSADREAHALARLRLPGSGRGTGRSARPAEPSARERARKWGRRNRRLAAATGLLKAAVVAAAVVTTGYTRLTHLAAEVTTREFAADARAAVVLLADGGDRPWHQRGRAMRRLWEFDQSDADFARVASLRPDFPLGDLVQEAGR